ncbi:MAG: hypothetical protein JW874_07580 [Spirochaetales bacterium]|nr:hypothetical protein [Spirochaetales bacterium]
MKQIKIKLIPAYSLFFCIWNFAWINSVVYLMNNRPFQIRLFVIPAIIIWFISLVAGIAVLLFLANPIDRYIRRSDRYPEEYPDERLVRLAKRSLNLPFYALIMYLALWVGASSAMFFVFMAGKSSAASAASIWVGGFGGLLTSPIIFFGFSGMAVQKINSHLTRILKLRRIEVRGFFLSFNKKFIIPYVSIGLGFVLWIAGIGLYTAENRIIREYGRNELAYQKILSEKITAEGNNSEAFKSACLSINLDENRGRTVFLTDKSGRIVFASAEKDLFDPDNQAMNDYIVTALGDNRAVSFYDNFRKRLIAITPYDPAFVIVSSLDVAGNDSGMAAYFFWITLFGMGGVLITLLAGFFMAKWLSGSLVNILDNISHKDITNVIGKDSEDDFSRLIDDYNLFMHDINELVTKIRETVLSSSETSVSLANSIQESSASLHQMQANIENINKKTIRLDEEIQISSEQTKEIESNAESVLDNSSEQAASINEGSASIEEINSTIRNFFNSVNEKMELAKHLENDAASGKTEMEETSENINKVSEYADIITDTLKVINAIAGQTNLLAMNAAIEAAHAGSAGRGFSVVAEEIRKLSEATGKNAREISNSLKQLVSNIYESRDKAEKTKGLFNNIYNGVEEISGAMCEIRDAIQELTTAASQIVQAFGEMMKSSTSVNESAARMSDKSKGIRDSMVNVSEASTETKSSIQEFVIGLSEVQKAIAHISATGDKNIQNIRELDTLMQKFSAQKENY